MAFDPTEWEEVAAEPVAAPRAAVSTRSVSPSSTAPDFSDASQWEEVSSSASYNPRQAGRDSASNIDGAGAVGAGLVKGATFGFDDEIAGGVGAGYQALKNLTPWGNGKSIGENYESSRDYVRGLHEGIDREHAIAQGVGTVGSAVGGALATGGLSLGAGLGARVAAGALNGAAQGGANALGNNEDPNTMWQDAGQGLIGGAVTGGAVPGVGPALAKAGSLGAKGLGAIGLGAVGAGVAGAGGVDITSENAIQAAGIGAAALAAKYGGKGINALDRRFPGTMPAAAGQTMGRGVADGANPNYVPSYQMEEVRDPETTGSIATGPASDADEVQRRIAGSPFERMLVEAKARGGSSYQAMVYTLSSSNPQFRKLMGWQQ